MAGPGGLLVRVDRRQLLLGGLCVAAAGLAPPARAAFAHPLGFQVYAVRDALLHQAENRPTADTMAPIVMITPSQRPATCSATTL